MSSIICYSCAGNGVIKNSIMDPGGINPAKPGAGRVLQCTSCAGTGIERTFTPQ